MTAEGTEPSKCEAEAKQDVIGRVDEEAVVTGN